MTNQTVIPTLRTPRPSNVYNPLKPDVYPARIVRFVGLGIQDQKEFQGQAKDPAFKCAIQFELIGVDATGVDSEGKPLEPRPSCVFQDYFLFPRATRGKVFDLCRAIDASIEASPSTLDWFIERLGEIVMVQVGNYTTKDGVVKNTVQAVQPTPSFMKANIGEARSDLVGFNPYVDNEANLAAYSKMFKFQRGMLLEAHDSASIPFAGKEVLKQDGEAPKTTNIVENKASIQVDHSFSNEESPF